MNLSKSFDSKSSVVAAIAAGEKIPAIGLPANVAAVLVEGRGWYATGIVRDGFLIGLR
jgi:hypothetical protein